MDKKKRVIFFLINGVFTIALIVFGILSCVLGRPKGFVWHLVFAIGLNLVNIIRLVFEIRVSGILNKKE